MLHGRSLSIVTPAFNEGANLGLMYTRLCAALDPSGLTWDWIVVDDHSSDDTFEIVRELAERDSRIRGARLSRNCGSHAAILCGIRHAGGDAVAVMAADLQDPPELLPTLATAWVDGAQVVLAARRARPGESRATVGFARLYYWVLRRVVGLDAMPATGVDFFLIDRLVAQALASLRERNLSLIAVLVWMGFRQRIVEYDKQPRLRGRSGWSLRKRMTLLFDSVAAFSNLPGRLASWLGAALAIAALGAAALALAGLSLPGDAWIWPAVLGLGAVQFFLLALLAGYAWRALDEARGRPPYLIEATLNLSTRPTESHVLEAAWPHA